MKIQNLETGEAHKVYGAKETHDGKTKFLIFTGLNWSWISSNGWIPYNDQKGEFYVPKETKS